MISANYRTQKFVTIFLTVIYLFFVGWFLKLYLLSQTEGTENLLTNFYGILPLMGGIYGLMHFRHWGGWHSAVGKAMMFLSMGLLTWGVGIIIWIYYNFVLQVEIPYPSWADAAFIVSWPLWGIGVYFLSLATGAKSGLRKAGGKFILLLVPIFIIAFSYYFLVTVARGGVLLTADEAFTIFFDVAYPIGDVVILTLAALVYGLSRNYIGGKYRSAVFLILAAFILNYFADFAFSYTITTERYYNGSLADFLFATTMYVFSLGIIFLDNRPENSRQESMAPAASTYNL